MLRSTLALEQELVHQALSDWEQGDNKNNHKVLTPVLQTPRGRFLVLEAGGVSLVVRELKKIMAESSTSISSLAAPLLLPVCRLLALCCQDTECGVAIGLLGGHPLVQRLLALPHKEEEDEEEEDVEELRELAEDIASRCARVRGGFPVRTLALCEASGMASLQLPTRMFFKTKSQQQQQQQQEDEDLVVLLRPISDRRMGSQADTGFSLWPAATILARWIALHPELFQGQVAMEVGAGLGLCGLVAGRFAERVVLTEYNLVCLQRLQEHVELNIDDKKANGQAPGAAPTVALSSLKTMQVRWLDWDKLEKGPTPSTWQVVDRDDEQLHEEKEKEEEEEEEEEDKKGESQGQETNDAFGRPGWTHELVDVVLVADCICDEGCAKGVALLLSLTLKHDTGRGYVTAPFPEHRYGVHAFPQQLAEHGLMFEQEEVIDPRLLEGLAEAAYMRFHLFTVWRPSSSTSSSSQ